ncbi:MAG: leucine-rich repeat protein [Oscillospiraceae bacterium]|nr:leucine-rich repeat protein [Oscillospiraceae bacterium]
MLNILKTEYVSRVLAVLLSATLCFGFSPFVFAMEGETETEIIEDDTTENPTEEPIIEEEKPKVTNGTCGTNLSWEFSAGTLTISGSGEMNNYSDEKSVPWYGIRNEILKLSLPEGLTSVGKAAFYGCKNIVSVKIPNSVTKIGDYAFSNCRGMTMLGFGSRVETIGDSAFSDCYSISSIRLPDSLRKIGKKAFYRCESITTITVPANVTEIGMKTFAYCKNLVSANIQAKITVVPELMFYECKKLSSITLPDTIEDVGEHSFRNCDSLAAVYYNGESVPIDELEEEIGAPVSEGSPSGENTGGVILDNGDGTVTAENTTVTEGEDSTVSATTEITVTTEGEFVESSEPEVSVSISGEKGWEESVGVVEDIIREHGTADDGSERHIDIEIFLQGTETVDVGFIEMIAGKDVTVTITTENGSVWVINGKDINVEELSGNYSFAYVLEAGSAELCEKLGASSCFVLRFLAPAEINAEVMIRIGGSYARRNATLFQDGKEVSKVQSAVVDNEGYAHFYLGSVTEKTEYYIGMDIAGASEEAIVPQNMLAEYGNMEYIEPIRYEITGRTSSWGMGLGQVMSILAVVMVSVIVVVGAVMFFWNRQRLKNGYVPQMDDDE